MVKNFTTLVVFLSIFTTSFGQQTINSSIMHDDLERDYILYIPASYTGDVAFPLVFNFHGYTSNASDQMNYGDFRSIADTAGFLVVHPMGEPDIYGQPHWNMGQGGTNIDDLGFTSALMDTLLLNYNIDEEKVYTTGMSNGGFMSYYLACHLSERFAAIASVTGTMTNDMINNCFASHPMPVMEIHGTADNTVPYNGNDWMESVDDVLSHWVNFNNCNVTPAITDVPDINTTDGSTVEHYLYSGGDNGVAVEHYKVIGGGHTWPGSAYNSGMTNYDINASLKIWQFFAKYDINGSINPTALEQPLAMKKVKVYPNPATTEIHIETGQSGARTYQIIDIHGRQILQGHLNGPGKILNVAQLPEGLYVLRLGRATFKFVKT